MTLSIINKLSDFSTLSNISNKESPHISPFLITFPSEDSDTIEHLALTLPARRYAPASHSNAKSNSNSTVSRSSSLLSEIGSAFLKEDFSQLQHHMTCCATSRRHYLVKNSLQKISDFCLGRIITTASVLTLFAGSVLFVIF